MQFPTISDIKLTSCQQNALKILSGADNVFLTGVAGSGKSFLLQHFLKSRNSKENPVVASTGAAAVIVGGVTFHSFFGLGILEGGVERTVQRALKDKRLKSRLRKAQLVVIDEVSMIPGQALRAAETICRCLRDKPIPWGGIKIVAVGDFGQLPPVGLRGTEKDWAFMSETWRASNFQIAHLSTIVRSKDEEFLRVLNFIREGEVNEEVTDFLNSRLIPVDENFTGTHLFPHRQTVEDFNVRKLESLPGELVSFETIYSGETRYLDQMKKSAPIPEFLQIKVGALVMMRKNDVKTHYVNGSLGTITAIDSDFVEIELLNGNCIQLERETFSYMNADGEVVAAATNFPINLAWATTIHKCQGLTLDAATMDLSRVFEAGQAYVALSRVRAPSGLHLSGWKPQAIRASAEVQQFHSQILNTPAQPSQVDSLLQIENHTLRT